MSASEQGSLEHPPLKIGTRGSPLALGQTRHVIAALREQEPHLATEIVPLQTRGENAPDRSIAEIGVGVFTRELDDALLAGTIDIAVHSLKDVPSRIDETLELVAVLTRESPLDAFVSARGRRLEELPPGSRIGTGSPRRKAQLLARWPEFEIVPLRGNLDTRLRKIEEDRLTGTLLAHAGLKRLGKEDVITQLIDPEIIVPAVAQGAIGVCARAGSTAVRDLLSTIDDTVSRWRVEAERSFLQKLRGGCQVPAGALATVEGDTLRLEGVIAAPDGSARVHGSHVGSTSDRIALGASLATDLLARGGEDILLPLRGA